MGFLDNIKDKAEEFGEKAKEGLGTVKDKASDLVEDVKDRFDKEDDASTASVSEDTNPLSDAVSSTSPDSAAADPYDEVLESARQRAEGLKDGPGPA